MKPATICARCRARSTRRPSHRPRNPLRRRPPQRRRLSPLTCRPARRPRSPRSQPMTELQTQQPPSTPPNLPARASVPVGIKSRQPPAPEPAGMSLRELWEAAQEHLSELRKRLMVIVIALLVTTLASFYFTPMLIDWLALPGGGTEKLIALEVTESVGVFMRVALLSGLILAMPVVVYEILAFILPALTDDERRVFNRTAPLVTIVASVLFLGGAAFAYFVMLPVSIPFLTTFLDISTTLRLGSYLNFVTGLMFWLGVGFETPILVYFLARMGLVTSKALLKQW
ncbi:twin-arginine translocase subunit TatC, partial [bacterium]